MKTAFNQLSKKAVLIELDGSHNEILYAQLAFLKHGGYHTTLIVDDKNFEFVKDYDKVDTLLHYDMNVGSYKKLQILRSIRRHILEHNIQYILFNTAQNNHVRTLCFMRWPKHIVFAGTLHSLHKLSGSFSQKLISRRVKKYFILIEYLRPKLKNFNTKGLQFEVYYAMFLAPQKTIPITTKPENTIWVGIPGTLEYARRDYQSLAYAVAKLQEPQPIRFLLLGNAFHSYGNGHEFKQLIAELGVEDYFVFWDGFLSDEEFHTYIKSCDILMPLLQTRADGVNVYLEYQISGIYNLAFAYKKPMLFADDFEQMEEFKQSSIFYNKENLTTILTFIKKSIANLDTTLYQDKQWTLAFQAERYLKFIEQ